MAIQFSIGRALTGIPEYRIGGNMGTVIWQGDAPLVSEVKTVTPASVLPNTTWTVTCNGKNLTYTAAANTVVDVVNGLLAIWNASTEPEFEEVTATNPANTALVLTHDTEGVPFTVTAATSGNGTLSVSTTTAASGPNCLNVGTNWSGGAVPANTNDVVFEYSDVDLLYQLDALAAITANSITIKSTYTGNIGLPRTNANEYAEYRQRYLQMGANTVSVGDGTGTGSSRVQLDLCNTTPTITVNNMGQTTEAGIAPLLIVKTAANTVLNVNKGSVGVAINAGETATITTMNVGYITNQVGDSTVVCGSGTTLGTITKLGGNLTVESNLTTLTQHAGTTAILGTATATTITINDGTLEDRSSGTFATVNNHGIYDKRKSTTAKTCTNFSMYKGAKFYDPAGTITLTNGIDLVQCKLSEVIVDRPSNKTWTETSI